MHKVALYDTTLRDGSQGEGISYSVADKIGIARALDEAGIHYIEGGWPGSNPKDMEFFQKMAKRPLANAKLASFSMTRRPGIAARDDANILSLLKARTPVITIVGKTWDLHVHDVLKVSLEENIAMIADTVSFLVAEGAEVFYDAEHFFDAYAANPAYSLKCLKAAEEAGAAYLCLCDTNGGTLPLSIHGVVADVGKRTKSRLGIHCHNDAGVAVANTIMAVSAGARMVQGTINGYGERCGNADLIPIIANLRIKMGIDCMSDEKLAKLTAVSHFVAEISNMKPQSGQPYTGQSAFAHKGGMHINAVMKAPAAYEHVNPALVGNHRRMLVSELGGKTGILMRAHDIDLDLKKDDPQTKKILETIQKLEHRGYHFEAAEASLELLMKKALKKVGRFFELEGFKVVIEKKSTAKITSEAIVKLKVKGKREHTAADGDGPVNALDNALRKALKDFYPQLAAMELTDFKVRVLDEKAGTAARVRVLIQSRDDTDTWNTIGVHENIIEASWEALSDSVEYKLLKDGAR